MRRDSRGLPPFWTSHVHTLLDWARRHSAATLPWASACCGDETRRGVAWDALTPVDDLQVVPEHADVLVVAGKLSLKWVGLVVDAYNRMPEGRRVIAFGACAISGGLFDTYAHVQGIDRFIPVDLYVPGCPPRPEALVGALRRLRHPKRHPAAISTPGRAVPRRAREEDSP